MGLPVCWVGLSSGVLVGLCCKVGVQWCLGLFVCCVGCWLAIWLGFGLVILVSDVACY